MALQEETKTACFIPFARVLYYLCSRKRFLQLFHMIVTVLLALVGIAMVMLGARGLTDGASAVAHRLSVPPIVVGLTVVALGTSAPEFFISLTSF